MKTSISNKEIWNIAYPIMLGNLAQTIITFTDTAFLGHLGVVELGASMMAGLYYYVFTTLAMGFAVGIQIIVARRFGEKNYGRIGVVFEHGALFIFFLGLIMFSILRYFSPLLLKWIIGSPNIYVAAMEYINYRQFGILFVCFNFLFRSFYVGISNTKVITFSTLLMAVVNIFLDYCLIFGNFGFPNMGVGGAAFASFSAEVAATLFFLLFTFFAIPKEKFGMFRLHKLEPALMGNILKIAFPTMLQRLFSFGAWFVFFVLIEKMGELNIGISSIVRSVYMILIIPTFSFGATANTLTSRLIGDKKSDEVMPTLNKILKNSLLCTIPLVIICAIIPQYVLQIYTEDPMLSIASIPAVYVICAATIMQAIAMVFFEGVSGTGNTAAALYLEFGILILYVLYIMMLTSLNVAIQWVWTAEWLYSIILGCLSILYMKRANWQKKVI